MPSRPILNPPPYHINDINRDEWKRWFENVFNRFGNPSFPVKGSTVANLPPADENADLTGNPFTTIIFVVDSADGPTIAFSDGTDWISLITGNTV